MFCGNEVVTTGIRDGKPFNNKHLFPTSLRTTQEALLQLATHRWSIEVWHWIRDTQSLKDALRYQGNGAAVMGSLRTDALNLLRLAEFRLIRPIMQNKCTTLGSWWGWHDASQPSDLMTL